MKRNVTVAMDETVARWVRVEAARADVSVSEYLASLLRSRMRQGEEYERAMSEYLSATAVTLKQTGRYPRRADLHERNNGPGAG